MRGGRVRRRAELNHADDLEGSSSKHLISDLDQALAQCATCTGPLVAIRTTMGTFVVELFPDQSPIGVASVIDLVTSRYYDGSFVHRSVPNFGIQFGCNFSRGDDRRLWGRGGPPPNSTFAALSRDTNSHRRDHGGNIPDEFITRTSNVQKTVCLAAAPGVSDESTVPNSRGSQLFINCADNSFLNWFDDRLPDVRYTVIGHVVANWYVVAAINDLPTDSNDVPRQPVQLLGAIIAQRPAASETMECDLASESR
jgi:peptidyl-prolyl cis-trans isomerase B (cyclophilin B)